MLVSPLSVRLGLRSPNSYCTALPPALGDQAYWKSNREGGQGVAHGLKNGFDKFFLKGVRHLGTINLACEGSLRIE
jgi:hypothetical protein